MKIRIDTYPGNGDGYNFHEIEGLTLRDLFAMAALAGICMRAEWYGDDAAAKSSFEIADAMLAARDPKPDEVKP